MPSPAPESGTSTGSSETLTARPASAATRLRVGDARAAGDRDEHEEQPVQRPAEREPRQRAVGAEVLRRGEQPHHPAREQRHRAHDDARRERVVGGDERVQPRRLLVALDRVGQRRPRVLEAAHGHEHDGGELDRHRVEARGGVREGREQVKPVGHLQRVHARVGRDGRQPEAQHRAQVLAANAQREAAAQHPPQPEHDDRRGAEVAEQQARARPVPRTRRA